MCHAAVSEESMPLHTGRLNAVHASCLPPQARAH